MANYKNLEKNIFSRRFGGTSKGVVDPYITGYFYGFFVTLPSAVIKATSNIGDATRILNSGILSVTIPTATLNKTTLDGLGGLKWHAPTNIDIGDTCSIKYSEMSGLPYFKIYHEWFNAIRDYRTGVSGILTGDNYSKTNYAAEFLYAATKPDGLTVEFAVYMTGMFPTKDPYDLYQGDVTAVDKVDFEQEFSVDYVWVCDDWVMKKATSLVEGIKGEITTIQNAEFSGGPASL